MDRRSISSDDSEEFDQATRNQWLPPHLTQEVNREWTDLILLMGCFATGLLDAAVFNVWQCFVSMQTGNTVYVGLGVTSQPSSQPYRWIKSGASIIAFMIGSFIFSNLSNALTPLRRSTLISMTLLQSILIFIPALLVTLEVVPNDAGDLVPRNLIVLLPLALLAMSSGGQCVLSRTLGFNELPSVVLTSAMCDIAMDEKLFKGVKGNGKRNRRIASVLTLLAGAAVGGWMTQDEKGIEGALWVVGGVKVGMAVTWAVWRGDEGSVRLA